VRIEDGGKKEERDDPGEDPDDDDRHAPCRIVSSRDRAQEGFLLTETKRTRAARTSG
jgi:hypothetical protein